MRLGTIEREILEKISAGDILVGFLCSAMSTRRMYRIARARAKRRGRVDRAIQRLADEGCLRLSGGVLSIEEKGARLLNNEISRVRASLHSQKWDGKWRIVAYDIPEELKDLRDQVRYVLIRAGFKKLQNSLWIFPHECAELTALLQEDDRLKKHMLYGLLEHIEGDERFRRVFALSE